MSLSWNEIRIRAKTFAEENAQAHYEKGETQTFYNEFFEIFGIKRRQVARYEEHVKKLDEKTGFIDLFWPEMLIIEQKSAGRDLAKAKEQAGEYFDAIPDKLKPRFQLLSDFQNFELLDRDTGEEWSFELSQLHENVECFAFMIGREKRKFIDQDPVNIEASEIMGAIHDDLKESGYEGANLERYLVRLLFMMFADDTGIFQPRAHLLDVLQSRTNEDGSDLGQWIQNIFEILDTNEDARNKNIDEDLNKFPYVNGDLFKDPLPMAYFTSAMRERFLDACRFNWSQVSPAIFGSLFQSVMDPVERRKKGAHYTTEKNIMKVIEPLFLDELNAEFEKLKQLRRGKQGQLEAFRRRLGTLTFLDPACGCGNFLIIAYRELRKLEIAVLQELKKDEQLELDAAVLSAIDVDQFYGIEYEEFPSRIAEVAMWMIDHIMNVQLGDAFGLIYSRIPLRKSPQILHADALETDWNDLLPAHLCSYVFGNPPFIGSKYQSELQRKQVREIAKLGGSGGTLDYVCAWFLKAGAYANEEASKAQIAFVSTNSIVQGEQVAQLWPLLFDRYKLEISFAHRTFEWGSEARGKAHVHVVIVGLCSQVMEPDTKRLFSYDDVRGEPEETRHKALTAYLFGADNSENRYRVVLSIGFQISERPKMQFGNMPNDGGHLILSPEEFATLRAETKKNNLVRRLVGAHDVINGKFRYCLWLYNADVNLFKSNEFIIDRIKRTKSYRLESKRKATNKLAETPTLFGEIRHKDGAFVLIPRHSSERREYLPLEFFDGGEIAHDSCLFLSSSNQVYFGILISKIHTAWLRNIGGRLKSDYRYSVNLVYNTFPWPEMNEKQEAQISELAQAVLDARDEFPDSTLADLYDPDLMPPTLRKAHSALDKAVDRLYSKKPFESERERVEHLFMLYEKMVAPIEAKANEKPKRERKKQIKPSS